MFESISDVVETVYNRLFSKREELSKYLRASLSESAGSSESASLSESADLSKSLSKSIGSVDIAPPFVYATVYTALAALLLGGFGGCNDGRDKNSGVKKQLQLKQHISNSIPARSSTKPARSSTKPARSSTKSFTKWQSAEAEHAGSSGVWEIDSQNDSSVGSGGVDTDSVDNKAGEPKQDSQAKDYASKNHASGQHTSQHSKPRVTRPKAYDAPKGTVVFGTPKKSMRTLDVYDSRYRPALYVLPGDKQLSGDRIIANAIFPRTLEQLVILGIIQEGSFEAMPLGISRGRHGLYLDFSKGMADMWDAKISRAYRNKCSKATLKSFRERKNYFLKKLGNARSDTLGSAHPTTLRKYRDEEISIASHDFKTACNNYADKKLSDADECIRAGHKSSANAYKEVARFMRNLSNVFSEDILLGYNIQEITPAHCNPVYRARLLDLLLRHGKEIVEGFPAMYDSCMSYGPFQLTAEFAQSSINSAAEYIPESRRPPQKLADYSCLQHHAVGAAMFAFNNWKNIAWYLSNRGLLTEFNNHFENYKDESIAGDTGLIQRQLLVSGLTAAMHYAPGYTMPAIADYLREHMIKTGPQKGCLRTNTVAAMAVGMKKHLPHRVERYYTGASEAYHLLRVYDGLDDNYAAQYALNKKSVKQN